MDTMNIGTANCIGMVNAAAPTRICDCGGWTDTWFASYGKVFNIAVYPYAEVSLRIFDRPFPSGKRIIIDAEDFGDRYVPDLSKKDFDRHPLIEAAITYMKVPSDVSIEVNIHSEMPAGCSTGTSAAVTVAIIGALNALVFGRLTPQEVAITAQRIETEMLGHQCGIQDQLCSAHGGICFIDMYKYPHASVSRISIDESTRWELERRLSLVYLGRSHSSSDVHRLVIKTLEGEGADNPKLNRLRGCAERAKSAMYAGNFKELGAVMTDNTEAQRDLNSALVSVDAQRVMDIAKEFGALGWKLNGAGGDGGSLTILSGPEPFRRREMMAAILAVKSDFRNIPVCISEHGLRVWRSL